MRRRHPSIPRLWLITDERMGEQLWPAIRRLPRGAGIVVRHYSLAPRDRRKLLRAIVQASRGRHVIVGAAALDGPNGNHNGRRSRALNTRSVHTRRELVAARRAGADAIFVSPVFPTQSHPGAPTLGRVRLGLLLRGSNVPAIALGGMDAKRFRSLRHLPLHGWAAIDAWL
jgi:thiamine-phosphate pyrophosphorylase